MHILSVLSQFVCLNGNHKFMQEKKISKRKVEEEKPAAKHRRAILMHGHKDIVVEKMLNSKTGKKKLENEGHKHSS